MIITGKFYGQEVKKLTRVGILDEIVVKEGIREGANDIDLKNYGDNVKGTIIDGDSVFALTDKVSARAECEVNIIFVNVGGSPAMLIQVLGGEIILEENGVTYSIDGLGDVKRFPTSVAKGLEWWDVENMQDSLIGMMMLQYNIRGRDTKLVESYKRNLGYNVLLSVYKDDKRMNCKSIRVLDYLDLSGGRVAFVKFDKPNADYDDEDDFLEDFADADEDIDDEYIEGEAEEDYEEYEDESELKDLVTL